LIKFKVTGKRYVFWVARVDAELPTKANSWRLNEYKGLALIKALKLPRAA